MIKYSELTKERLTDMLLERDKLLTNFCEDLDESIFDVHALLQLLKDKLKDEGVYDEYYISGLMEGIKGLLSSIQEDIKYKKRG